MKRIRNSIVVIAGLGVVVGIAAFADRKSGAQNVVVERVAYGHFTVKLPETGVLQRPHVDTVPTLVAGNVERIYVRAGDRVRAGQILATIYNPTIEYSAAGSRADYLSARANVALARVQERNARVGYQAAVDTARSNLRLAQRAYQADVTLYANQAIPRQQLDQDRTNLEKARIAYQQAVQQLELGAVTAYSGDSVQYAIAAAKKARIINDQNQQQLAFTRIVAPFDGTIQTVATQPNDPLRSIEDGDAVVAGQALFTIARGGALIVRTKVDEQDIAQVHVGQRAIVSGEDFGEATYPGHVVSIAPTATKSDDPSATTRQVLTDIALDKTAPFMKDGMSADVDILTTDLRHVLTVPSSAVVTRKGRKYVWVVAAGKLARRAVATGKSNDTSTVVLRGLRAGETIVVKPDATLSVGLNVTVATPSPSPAPLGS